MSRIYRTIITITILMAAATGQEMDKRGPQGFLGMRGKKYNEVSEQFYKRKPQFFVGVKGKKAYDDPFESSEYKRAPMGFMGMRGKKDVFYDDKRAMGFVGMRGKKDFYFDEDKRAPTGFVGMRGKKELYADDEKRAMGFMGMRGKKDLYTDEEKRAMGFVGMRGKKELSNELNFYPDSYEYVPKRGSLIGQIDYNSNEENSNFPLLSEMITAYLNKLERPAMQSATERHESSEQSEPSEVERITNEVEKRAAGMHQFFGVRGKKSLENKRPYDLSFRGKFIGVRGKKDVRDSGAQEIKFLVDQNGMPKRKASMGFIGMRGKKWTDESSPETESSN